MAKSSLRDAYEHICEMRKLWLIDSSHLRNTTTKTSKFTVGPTIDDLFLSESLSVILTNKFYLTMCNNFTNVGFIVRKNSMKIHRHQKYVVGFAYAVVKYRYLQNRRCLWNYLIGDLKLFPYSPKSLIYYTSRTFAFTSCIWSNSLSATVFIRFINL